MDTHLDLFSTSQKEMCFSPPDEEAAKRKPCIYRAPLFWYRKEHTLAAHVVQGSCHHWDCPRCGVGRAKQEYARIVNGIPLLARSQDLWFMTFTCK
ncbi:MAG TPA: hypothetical protein VHS96_01705, partial [Bacteroidia bacterium]|nr:hypothetical protein [Bacteroidia bacterium]